MAKFLRVELKVPLTDNQAAILGDVQDFTKEEWNKIVAEAVQNSYLKEQAENIIITDTEVIDDDLGFVMPENKVPESSYWHDNQI